MTQVAATQVEAARDRSAQGLEMAGRLRHRRRIIRRGRRNSASIRGDSGAGGGYLLPVDQPWTLGKRVFIPNLSSLSLARGEGARSA